MIVVIGGPALTITLHFLADPLDRLARLSRRSSSVSSRPISAGKRLAVIAPVSGPSDVSQAYVDQLDPRFVTDTPLKAEGNVRMYATTDRSPAELSPFLHGTTFTLRNQTNAPGLDLEEAIRIATETLIPLFKSLPGFVLYCWLERPEGRIAINIWDTPEDLAAASDALGAWRAEYFATPTASEEVAYNGTVGYATITGLT